MKFPRASGILLHPVSLPSQFGIGDLGKPAYEFASFLAEAGQTYWQVLPLGPTGYGDSPYQSFSAMAGNPLLISPEKLVQAGLLSKTDLPEKPDFPLERIDYGKVIELKTSLLRRAYSNYKATSSSPFRDEFSFFCSNASSWLDDYALYRSIKDRYAGKAWYDWPLPLAKRDPAALAEAKENLSDDISMHKFFQFLFFRQWIELKTYANKLGIKIIGDIPIFVSYDSADVWQNLDYFKVDEQSRPTVVAGVPPDYFSKTGQLWGNPIYDWDKMKQDGFRWWIARVKLMLQLVDVVRFDHFRGFAACWEVPAGEQTAVRGRWVKVPGKELFSAIRTALGDVPIIAEDLGVITPDVEALRDEFGFPGMRVLQFAFGGDPDCADLPHNHIKNCVVYTGTHDNDTIVGWYRSRLATKAATAEIDYCLRYLNSDGSNIHWDFIRAAFASVADTAIVPVQDLLGLGSEARMNLPASDQGNWNWRMQDGALTAELAVKLRQLTAIYGRLPRKEAPAKPQYPPNYPLDMDEENSAEPTKS
ncbi:MAG: 4-alpha-glucanotransferase [Acidobacteriota bacterium]|nr:4-alpha-glucanotransferase [Blastocatellia bacterium]MDW8411372.1 4-alpha-glucanotransferase [Acidobacteriota bacterium]